MSGRTWPTLTEAIAARLRESSARCGDQLTAEERGDVAREAERMWWAELNHAPREAIVPRAVVRSAYRAMLGAGSTPERARSECMRALRHVANAEECLAWMLPRARALR